MDNKNIIVRFNANPWGVRTGDCVIRAIVLGLGFDYKEACKKLGVACKKGHGLVRDSGIDLYDVKEKFKDYFDVIQDYYEDMTFVPDEFKGTDIEKEVNDLEGDLEDYGTYGMTLKEFIKSYKDQGYFLVSLVSPKGDGHIVFVNCKKDKNFAVDTFDSSNFKVDAFMKIKKTLPKDDPRHFKLDPVTKAFIV